MSKDYIIEEDEFTDILTLQWENHKHLQNKARNTLSLTGAAVIGFGTLISAGVIEPFGIFNFDRGAIIKIFATGQEEDTLQKYPAQFCGYTSSLSSYPLEYSQ